MVISYHGSDNEMLESFLHLGTWWECVSDCLADQNYRIGHFFVHYSVVIRGSAVSVKSAVLILIDRILIGIRRRETG